VVCGGFGGAVGSGLWEAMRVVARKLPILRGFSENSTNPRPHHNSNFLSEQTNPPANSTFLSEQTSHQQPVSSTFLSAQTITSHQPPAKRTDCQRGGMSFFILYTFHDFSKI
jgi:hypothetical protein